MKPREAEKIQPLLLFHTFEDLLLKKHSENIRTKVQKRFYIENRSILCSLTTLNFTFLLFNL